MRGGRHFENADYLGFVALFVTDGDGPLGGLNGIGREGFLEWQLPHAGGGFPEMWGEVLAGSVAVDFKGAGDREGLQVKAGAVVVHEGRVIARDFNRVEALKDATAHAEMLAIREAARTQGAPRLDGMDLYVTLEPCAMCAQAIALARIRRLYFGAYDSKSGGVEHGARVFTQPTCHHKPEVIGGIDETRAAALLKDFFKGKR